MLLQQNSLFGSKVNANKGNENSKSGKLNAHQNSNEGHAKDVGKIVRGSKIKNSGINKKRGGMTKGREQLLKVGQP